DIDFGTSQGFWLENAISILNKSETVYLECGKEGVVFTASPLISFDGEVFYRFKQWKIYQRENAESMYLDGKLMEEFKGELYNPIFRFAQNRNGYYLILPVYEKIYSLSIATQLDDNTINVGGSVNIISSTQSIKIDPETYQKDMYFIEYIEGGEVEYADISNESYLYFTGKFASNGYPIFKKLGIAENYTGENAYSYIVYEETENPGTYTLVTFKGGEYQKHEHTYVNYEGALEEGKPCLVNLQLYATTLDASTYSFYMNKKVESVADAVTGIYKVVVKMNQQRFKSIYDNVTGEVCYHYSDIENINYATITDILTYVMETRVAIDSTKESTALKNSRRLPVLLSNNSYYAVTSNEFVKNKEIRSYNVEGNIDMVSIDGTSYYFKRVSGISRYQLYAKVSVDKSGNKVLEDEFKLPLYVRYKNSNTIYYSTSIGLLTASNKKVADLKIELFNDVSRNPDSVASNGNYFNTTNNLSTGELYSDKNGRVYSTLQYKTSYFDRDSSVTLTAVPNSGYRLDGWYLARFDSTFGWVVSDKTIDEELNSTYSDPIVKTQFVTSSDVTTYTLDLNGIYPGRVAGSKEFKRKYSISKSSTTAAIFSNDFTTVPDSIKDDYVGIFVNLGVSRTSPYFVQVYMKNNSVNELYYDQEYTRKVRTS
ncbi:MAG: hypothetical protein IJA23_02010, partial [Clostridia bacterium]|nr:hypothetical protein [Clostridia bacterium]